MRSLKLATVSKSLKLSAVCTLLLFFAFGSAGARADETRVNLQLEVFINGAPANMISSFVRFGSGQIGSPAGELRELGLKIDPRKASTELIMLDDIPSMRAEYNEKDQSIHITIDDSSREPKSFDLRTQANAKFRKSKADWGAALNYDLFATTYSVGGLTVNSFAGSSLTLDGRAFSPYGTLGQSVILRSPSNQNIEAIRLDTSFRTSDEGRLVTYTVGDAINGGLAWTRPIRIGGLQGQSNFALRPDLITMPLPSIGGTAAVPSTVDVYVNNIKTFSQDVGTGPFQLNNIPLITGSGNTEVVVRDSSGHESRTSAPFYASANLLAPEIMSWSAEVGVPRLFYGSTSDTYVDAPIGSVTLRRGIYDWLTVEAHAEAGAGVANSGVGGVVKIGSLGVVGTALSESESAGSRGTQAYMSYETKLVGLNIVASTQRTFGNYNDLASATARVQSAALTGTQSILGLFNNLPMGFAVPYFNANSSSPFYASTLPPVALDRITFSAPLGFDPQSGMSTSFLHSVDALGNISEIASETYTRSLPFNASLFATVFHDFGTNKNTGVFAGLTIPIGNSASVSSYANVGHGTTGTVDAIKALGPEPGSYGWHIQDSEGYSPSRAASASYRSGVGSIQGTVNQNQSGTNGSVELRGAIVTMGGGAFLTNWVDDSFAVVDAGAPDVEVLDENRPMGTTGSNGMILLPNLRSYQNNKISLNPNNLPVDAALETTREFVTPAGRAGTLVKFKVRSETNAALVTFVRPNGSFVSAGANGHIEGGGDFIVGYDGQAFIRELSESNKATIDLGGSQCESHFDFTPRPGEQVQITNITCQ